MTLSVQTMVFKIRIRKERLGLFLIYNGPVRDYLPRFVARLTKGFTIASGSLT